MLNWLLFLGVKIAHKFQHFVALARVPKQMWPSVGIFRKLLLRSKKWYIYQADCMYQSGNLTCQGWPITGKLCTFKQLYWLNQVTTTLAVQARILRIIFSTKPNPHCVSLVRKVDLIFGTAVSDLKINITSNL